MKIAVVGATGQTGNEVVKQALAKGHKVLGILRNPDKIDAEIRSNPNFSIAQANIFDEKSLAEVLVGVDAVISCLGFPIQRPKSILTGYSESIMAIVDAMKLAKVPRLVAMTSWCTEYLPTNPKWIEWLFKPLLIGRNLDDMHRMELWLGENCKSDDITYTCVRPPGLTNGQLTDKKISTEDGGQWIPGASQAMSRADVARFLLDCVLSTKQWDNKCLAISVNK